MGRVENGGAWEVRGRRATARRRPSPKVPKPCCLTGMPLDARAVRRREAARSAASDGAGTDTCAAVGRWRATRHAPRRDLALASVAAGCLAHACATMGPWMCGGCIGMVADESSVGRPEGGGRPLLGRRRADGPLPRSDGGAPPRGLERWECAGLALGAVGRGAARPGVPPPLYQESDGAGRVHRHLVSGDGGDLAPIIACELRWLSGPGFFGYRHTGWSYVRSSLEEWPHAYDALRRGLGHDGSGPGAWCAMGEGFEVVLRSFHPRRGVCHPWRGVGRLGARPSGQVAVSLGRC